MLVPAIKQNPLTSLIAQSLLQMLQNQGARSYASEEAEKQRAFTAEQNDKLRSATLEGRKLTSALAAAKLGVSQENLNVNKQKLANQEALNKIKTQEKLGKGLKEGNSLLAEPTIESLGGDTGKYVDMFQKQAGDTAVQVEQKAMAPFERADQGQEDSLERIGAQGSQTRMNKATPSAPRAADPNKPPPDRIPAVSAALAKWGNVIGGKDPLVPLAKDMSQVNSAHASAFRQMVVNKSKNRNAYDMTVKQLFPNKTPNSLSADEAAKVYDALDAADLLNK